MIAMSYNHKIIQLFYIVKTALYLKNIELLVSSMNWDIYTVAIHQMVKYKKLKLIFLLHKF